ncbi:MAG: hypothetical protein HYT35_00925 [Candidatus Staskawiczbacteria bacterium]|nr:hypothetical protein [Candidatus Staskawiczbacteria bacterium]
MIDYKKILKFTGIFLLTLFILYLGAEIGFQVKYKLELWKTDRAMEKFNKSIEELFKSDIYGGNTPEETFNLFVDALKNEDVDLAIKYIVIDIERRQRYYDDFNKMQQKGELKDYAEALPKWEEFEQVKDNYNDWEKRATVEHGTKVKEPMKVYDQVLKVETVIQPGIYTDYSIILIKNQNNIWKIESL